MKNNVFKKIFLAISMVSLSILLTATSIMGVTFLRNYSLSGSYMHREKKIIEPDFYKSSVFEINIVRSLVHNIEGTAKTPSEDEIDYYIKENTSTDWVEYTDKDGVIKNKEQIIVPSKEEAIKVIENNIKSYKEELKNNFGEVKYIVKNNKDNLVYSNTEYKTLEDFKKNINEEVNIAIEKNQYGSSYTKEIEGKVYKNNSEVNNMLRSENIQMYISIPKKINSIGALNDSIEEYNTAINNIQTFAIIASVSLVVFLLSTILYKLIKEEAIKKNGMLFKLINKIPLEIWTIGIGFVTLVGLEGLTSYEYGYRFDFDIVFGFACILINLIALYLIIKIFKSYENKADFFKHTVAYKVYKSLKNIITNLLVSSKKMPLINNIILVSVLISGGSLFIGLVITVMFGLGYIGVVSPIFIAIPALTYYIVSKLDYLTEIMEGAKQIKEGDLHYKIDVKGYNHFTQLAEDINNIGEGLEKSIDKQLRSERMRSELITNVSHDLKTPLTSIINYVELIKKEENIQPEYIKDYVSVLDTKSKRLKILIEDLFEASKASSGNIDLNMEKIEITQLLEQSIGELEEKLSEANLDLKINTPNEKIYAYADGRRMYRVFENLLSNIAKYSLQNTRVYIDLIQEDSNIKLTMKNISSYELNFDASEMTERFKRADESRNTEGSGLGLAIAKDLVELQNGKFNIDIDGDLFKVSLEFKKIEK
ncbi:histidine kinase dimerization/phospho-acceptor domain-containing protein [Romboutsia sp.]|uniref:sensor histidine kinase n=1 Tax=Romboutsia sp. TaxID=1965302 RepID=UPI003F39F5DC